MEISTLSLTNGGRALSYHTDSIDLSTHSAGTVAATIATTITIIPTVTFTCRSDDRYVFRRCGH